MLSVQDRENIMGWAYVWLKDAAWTNTRATYCDVEPVCCDDIAKVWFLMSLIKRSTGVLGGIVCKDVTETITVEGNPATLTLDFINLPQNFQLFNGFLYGSDSGFVWRTSISSPVYGSTSQLPIRGTLAENAEEFVNWFNWYVANYPTTDPSGATLSASVNGTQITITTNTGTTFFNGISQTGFILVDQELWFGSTQQIYFLTGGTNSETETITVEVCEFVDSPDIDLLYQRLQCLIGLSSVTTCPNNSFPCTPVEPPTPPVDGCSVFVKSGCCDYEAINCKINNYDAWVCLDLPETLIPDGEVGRLTITIFAINKIYTGITEPLSRLDIIQDLINEAEDIGYDWYTTETGICIYQANNFDGLTQVTFSTYVGGEPSGSFTEDIDDVVFFCGNFRKGDVVIENSDAIDYASVDFYPVTVEVLVNCEWEDVTDEVLTGFWVRNNVCDAIITEWRVLDDNGNIVGSGDVTAECGGSNVVKTPCEWLQEHQTAIEKLEAKVCSCCGGEDCTLNVGDGCCDYLVEGIDPRPRIRFTVPNITAFDGDLGFMTFAIVIVPDELVLYLINGLENSQNYTSDELIQIITDTWIENEYYDLVINGNVIDLIPKTNTIYSIQLDYDNVFTPAFPYDSWQVSPFNVNVSSLVNIASAFSFFAENTEVPLTFQVLINDTWTDVTDEVENGTWTRTNVCDDVITEWRILDSEDNVIDSGNVTANCEGSTEVTDAICNWLQAHQTAIEQLQAGGEGLSCEDLAECQIITDIQDELDNKANTSDLATVATTGSYNDLTDKPTIPAPQIQSDWNQANNAALDFIKNKPVIPTVPTNVSAFTNDAGYQTAGQVTNAIVNAKPVTVVGVDATANALTGAVTNGVLGSILIPANTMTTNSIVELEAFLSKASPSASPTHRVWINNANNITGATQLALQTGATANQMSKLERTFIVTSTGLTIYPTTASANIDDNVANAAPTNISVNWTVNQWLLHSANNASGETTTNVFLYAKKAQP